VSQDHAHSRFMHGTVVALAVVTTCAAVLAQAAPADRDEAAFAYAQCVRDNGYVEFPDPEPDDFKFLIDPDDVGRFKKAAAACQEFGNIIGAYSTTAPGGTGAFTARKNIFQNVAFTICLPAMPMPKTCATQLSTLRERI